MQVRDQEVGLALESMRLELVFDSSPEDADAERRVETRFPTNDPARMRVLQPLAGKGIDVRILDVSRGGFKLCVPEMLQPGTIIQVHITSAIILAEVRYCVTADDGFHAGVNFQDVFWTRHLSD